MNPPQLIYLVPYVISNIHTFMNADSLFLFSKNFEKFRIRILLKQESKNYLLAKRVPMTRRKTKSPKSFMYCRGSAKSTKVLLWQFWVRCDSFES